MKEAPGNRPSELFEALRAAHPSMPEALSTFDAVVGAASPAPDFFEWSARVSAAVCESGRLTYYFDVARRGEGVARAALARFSALAEVLGARVSPTFAQALGMSARDPAVLQLVLGVDERLDRSRRVKAYAVLREAAPELVRSLLEASGVAPSESQEAAKVYILGFDFDASGLVDAKLYYRLDPARLGRVVANLASVGPLLRETRDVVLLRCVRTGRSQIYLHATSASAVGRHLAARAIEQSAASALAERHAAAASRLARGRLEPWIVSFALDGHRLRHDESTIYFHHVGLDAT
jgi:hypothetical protein